MFVYFVHEDSYGETSLVSLASIILIFLKKKQVLITGKLKRERRQLKSRNHKALK